MLFRQDRRLDRPWTIRELKEARALNGAPQSITEVKLREGLEWIHGRLAA
jgi:hypothetical protein